MRTSLWLVLLALVAACHNSTGPSPNAPTSVAEQDALWKLAPDGAVYGIVASSQGIAQLEAAYSEVLKTLQQIPELQQIVTTQLAAELEKSIGTDKLTLAALGMSPGRGAALFMRADKRGIMILPVADRDKFLRITHGTKGADVDVVGKKDVQCKMREGFYTCVSDAAMWELIGKGTLDIGQAGARGQVEMVGKDLPMGKTSGSFAIVEQHARGAVTWRGKVMGLPLPEGIGGQPATPRTEGERTTGFATLAIKAALHGLPHMPDLIPGVDLNAIIASVQDPVTVTAQSTTLDMRVPLSDPAPMKSLLDKCALFGAAVGAKVVDGACEFVVPNLPNIPIDMWLDGSSLRIGQKHAAPGVALPQSALAKELEADAWNFAFYGRGSALAASDAMFASWKKAQQLIPDDMTPLMHDMVRALLLFNEVGVGVKLNGTSVSFVFGVRTMWSNDDDVVARLVAMNPDDIMNGKGAQDAKSFAKGPLADDIKAGAPGLMAPVAVVGVLAAVAVPAFMDYMKRSKESEASLELNKIGKSAKRYFGENGKYPVGDGALTSAQTCCGQPNNKCAAPGEALKKDPVWSALEFEIDEPTQYRYRYHSTDGKTAVVEALGDLDCDGTDAVWRLDLSLTPGGNPKTELTPPPSGVY
ncbi:MAG TPA: hypothetical protein VGL61_36355 [Kofleriaceae bacterium]|jgi:type II secretory pathway pseudopilin PulG